MLRPSPVPNASSTRVIAQAAIAPAKIEGQDTAMARLAPSAAIMSRGPEGSPVLEPSGRAEWAVSFDAVGRAPQARRRAQLGGLSVRFFDF